MSVSISAQVWGHSPQKGGSLLVLLAIADFCNDDGYAWPAVATLAQKARISERQTHTVLRLLEAAGELEIFSGEGPYGTNLYRVAVEKYIVSGMKFPHPEKTSGVKPTSYNPSLSTSIRESSTSLSSKYRTNNNSVAEEWPDSFSD